MNLIEPTLLLDTNKCIKNIQSIVEKANKNSLILRPHFKTHQSKTIANYFRDFGIDKITVSSLTQAVYFAEDDWNDITVAFPVNILEIDRINFLASKITLNLQVESQVVVEQLDKILTSPVNLFVKIDVGYHRTGIDPNNTDKIDSILESISSSSKLNFAGFLAHAGHTYDIKDKSEVELIHSTSQSILKKLKDKYSSTFRNYVSSIGDTPSCVLMNNFDQIDEIRPGTLVFFDLAQWRLGACSLEEIAIAMVCPVVAKNDERKEIIVYGGGVHFSRDKSVLPTGETYCGLVVDRTSNGWNIPHQLDYVKSLSQEHGVVKFNSDRFEKIKEGDLLTILPVHSCLTANLMKQYLTLDNKLISRL